MSKENRTPAEIFEKNIIFGLKSGIIVLPGACRGGFSGVQAALRLFGNFSGEQKVSSTDTLFSGA